MEGFLPSSMEDDVNMISDELDLQSLLSELELLSPPPEVPVNQSSISCNDQGGENNVINNSVQQTTPFPTSVPETMMEGFQPSFMEEVDNMTCNQLGFQSEEDTFNMSELLSLPPEVPGNQSSISCNDQGGQNNVRFQQTTPSPTSFPETMQMEGVPPSCNEDDVNLTSNQFDFQSQEDSFNISEFFLLFPKKNNVPNKKLSRSPPEFSGNQSSILCNDQDGQNMVVDIQQTTDQFPPSFPQTMTTMGDLDGTSSSWVNQNEPNWPQAPPREQQWTHYELPMSNQVPAMLPGPQPPMNQRHQNSFIHQPRPGHGYMIPNVTTSQHGGFNQSGPSSPAPWIQTFCNEGQVDQAAVIPNIDNMQQENFMPRSQMDSLQVRGLQNQIARPNASNTQQVETVGSKYPFRIHVEYRADGRMKCKFCQRTWANKTSISRFKCHLSGEEGRGVAICRGVTKEVKEAAFLDICGDHKRQKITASSVNVNDCGIPTCLQEQNIENENTGGGVGRVQREVQVVEPGVVEERISSHAIAGNDVVSMTGMRAQEDRVSEGALESRLRTEPVDRSLEQSNAVLGNMAGGARRIQVGVQGMEQDPGEERIQSHLQAENDMENTGEGSFQHDAFETVPRTEKVQTLGAGGDSSQFCHGIGRRYDQPCAPSVINDVTSHDEQHMVRLRTQPVQEEEDVENSWRSVVQAGAGARSSESLKYNNSTGVPLPTSSTKPVGQAFKENTKVIWSLLMDDEVPTIGIYGMGGVGKTTIVQHIHNELLQRPDICDHVWWVTVSQDFSVNRLQNLIAKHLDLDLSREVDDLHRAAKLSQELIKKQKWILILDDLWNNFELEEVGIPEKLKGCKLIMTTRSETVCHRMACQYKIKVKPLSEGEAWALFMKKLGCDIALSPEVAKAITRECAGLPLGISIVAGSLRGVDDLHEWRNTLKKLRESEFRDNEVFKLLRFSYDRLGDLALQQCLLYCALFPEDCEIGREELIGYMIDEGIIKGMRSRGDAFDEGHRMLNSLENVCLLESVKMEYDGSIGVKMHNLIRDMAIQILQENSQVMVKAGAQLKELPDAEEWTENLIRVSLMRNEIEEIPSSHSPRCPNLSTLFLRDNERLGFIADSFFIQLHGLKVLDMACTGIKNLPDSVSDLVSLTALLLNECENLSHVPSLKRLRALKRLDLSHTFLDEMPQGMECLSNLRYLRMTGCCKNEFPSGILTKLSHLQVFVLEECFVDSYRRITVEVKEVGSLRNLETLRCHFKGLSDFVEYLRSRDGIQSLSTYRISVGLMDFWECIDDFPSKTVALGNLSINKDRDFLVKFLNGIQGLVCQFIDARSLCDVLSLENATKLKRISIRDCNSMESLVSSSWFCSAPPSLPSYNDIFSGLKEFYCVGCNNMKKLFQLVWLPNLELIDVINCEKMEEIIGTTEEESSTSNSITELILPKLISLNLCWLPELKSICSVKLICDSLKDISVINCEKLKRMAICLPLLENGQPSPPLSLREINVRPKEWWERVVEWEHPNAKDVLSPFVMFREEEATLPFKYM